MNEFEDELNREERQAFDSLIKEKAPPPFLENRIVESLKQSSLIAPSRFAWPTFARVGVAAALFILGLLFGLWWASTQVANDDRPEFMLVLRSVPPQGPAAAQDEVRRRVNEYTLWARGLKNAGHLVGGEKLKREARFLRIVDGQPTLSEDLHESTGQFIAGYFLIRAANPKQALEVAEGCPHLKYGGTIEVRQIERF